MGRINQANIRKAAYYLKRNGLVKTWYAVLERLDERKQPPYLWQPPTEAELKAQRQNSASFTVTFSILVPAYRTKEQYLREMISSLQNQTYPKWELILADATEDDSVERVVRTIKDERICYVRLEKNAGIAENSNQGLVHASGDYVGLLDHDDFLTENALYEMASVIENEKQMGRELQMLYSDEDKCNGDGTEYYEPNFKEKFNLDLLLSNNYICHFLVMKRELIQELGFRSEYDGAQDFDLVLRAAGKLCRPDASTKKSEDEELIVHIPKVLYHWRCHTGSTAENPQSKLYAYEAGRRAIQDFADKRGWKATAVDTAHVGFYTLAYKDDILSQRPDIGAIGGRIVKKGRIAGGRMDSAGNIFYAGLPKHYSGYLHRAILSQNAEAVDIRNITVRQECQKIFEEVTGAIYKTVPGTERFDASTLPRDCDYIALSLALGKALWEAGYRILYLPK